MSDQFYQEDNHLLLCCGRLVGGVLPLLRLHSDPRLMMIMIVVIIVVIMIIVMFMMIMIIVMIVILW